MTTIGTPATGTTPLPAGRPPQVVDLLLWDGGDPDHRPFRWPWGEVRRAPSRPGAALAAAGAAGWVLLWHPRLGAPPADQIPALVGDRADVLHAGLLLGMRGLPPEIDFVQPQWWFAIDPPADRQAMSWRVSLDACLLRAEVVHQLGGLDPGFQTMAGAGLDFGWRCLARGAIVVHEPRLLPRRPPATAVDLPRRDRYLLIARHYPRRWARYVAARRALSGRPVAGIGTYRQAAAVAASVPPPAPPTAVYQRPEASVDDPPRHHDHHRVSVILPTLGRPGLVAQVLDDLRRQTVAPWEVLVVDQNGGQPAQPYARFPDLPLRVLHQDATGQWRARNAAVEQAAGDLLLFLDDDSRIGPDFVARHLEGLARYRADVSAGASLSEVGAPVPENYAFFRAADQVDTGNALVRREVLARVGGFDHHYDRMRGGDADFGTRVYLAGGLVVHNPLAARTHLKAATGGLRAFGSWDTYRQKGIVTPKPTPSVVYYSLRYFSARQAREGLLIGLAQSAVPYPLKRRATGRQWARFLAVEVLRLPLTAIRVTRSVRAARRMLAEGPRIPPVPAPPA